MAVVVHSLKDEKVAIFAACFVSLLAFLQGLDTAQISGFTAMPGFLADFGFFNSATQSWDITPSRQLLITCIINVGAAVGSLIAGPLGARFGSRYGLMLCALTSILGSTLQASSATLSMLICGRIFVGMGIGMATNFILVYQAEVAPGPLRGVLLGTFSLTYTFGGFVGTCINQGTHGLASSWSYRIPLLTQLVCPAIFLAGAWALPDSPRFLVSRGRVENAKLAYRRLHGRTVESHDLGEREIGEIIKFVEFEKATQRSTSYLDCFRGVDRRRTLIAMGLMTCQNFGGRDFLFSYGTYFFSVAGVREPFLISIILNLSALLAAVLSIPLVHVTGRRRILLTCVAGFVVCLFIFSSVGTAVPQSVIASKILITFMVLYNFLFTISLVVVASTVISETASTRLRSQAQSLAVFTAWSEAVMWTAVLPYLINPNAANLKAKIGFMYGGFGVCIWFFIFYCVPEYLHRPLEEINEMFLKGVAAREFEGFLCTGDLDPAAIADVHVEGSGNVEEIVVRNAK
ncbi:probable glucose transporter rco-3 [Aspergillus lentulus]|uniref:Probable glucose transporter rco-3 n=1 Tax=Aspergillus lentulus TaxID=293939 RepID=A0AAN4T8K1_ASPLE|nr:probable glucose transporter rco-3 [Aspergillus lentulus]